MCSWLKNPIFHHDQGIENDLKALRLIHPVESLVDTSVVRLSFKEIPQKNLGKQN